MAGERALALPERGDMEPERARDGPGPMCTPGGHRAAPERFSRGVCWRCAPFQCLRPWKGGRSSADGLIGEAREHCLRFDTGKGVRVGRKVGNMSANHVGGERETFSRFGTWKRVRMDGFCPDYIFLSIRSEHLYCGECGRAIGLNGNIAHHSCWRGVASVAVREMPTVVMKPCLVV